MPRKLLQLFFVITMIIFLLGNSQQTSFGIKLKNYPKNSIIKKALQLNSPADVGNIIILPKETFDEQEALSIITRIDSLPTSLLKKINHQGIRIKLFTGKLTDNPTAKHLQGVIPRGYKQAILWDEIPGIGGAKIVLVKIGASEKGKGHGSINLELHELAHSIDRHVFNGIRYNADFLKIWNMEKEKLFSNQSYFLTYPEEYFAEAFAMFYANEISNAYLRKIAPETYHYIRSL
ncbi:toxin [Bacillaceae bacterium Marseille-Q3522]|nr:toxin [Bacillaceae bacterium Marseille-Q3522]